MEPQTANGKNRLLTKALDVLACFTPEKPWLGVIEISKQLQLNKGNVYDILKTLEAYGYVQQDQSTSKYALGYEILTRSHVITSTMTHYDRIIPHLRLLAETGEVAYYGIVYDCKVLYLEQATLDRQPVLATRPMAGRTAPLYCTSIGKAMLAFMPKEFIERVMALPREAFTENTLVSEEALLADLNAIRARGYAIDNMEHEYGIKCVGAPIFDAQSQVVGAFSLVGPALRYTEETIEKYARLLTERSFELRAQL
ncbi:MAG: IclR family transcriptional regulator [Clostridiales bacterium]|jgi:DNA-binding IclR family transcriptional regulator|nr:IclR family transcriptional regulator [Clostridiales bacterium]